MLAKIRLYPVFLCFASDNYLLSSAKAEALNWSDKSFLPAMICPADGIIAAFWHPMDILTPKSRPPKTWLPGAMNPDFIGGTKLLYARPGRERHTMPFMALLAHDQPSDIRGAVPLLPPSAYMKNRHPLTTSDIRCRQERIARGMPWYRLRISHRS